MIKLKLQKREGNEREIVTLTKRENEIEREITHESYDPGSHRTTTWNLRRREEESIIHAGLSDTISAAGVLQSTDMSLL